MPPNPPRLAEWLLSRLSGADDRDCVTGDLAEEYRDVRVPQLGEAAARRWYWSQTLRSAGHRLVRGSGRAHTSPRGTRGGDGLMSNLLQDVRYGFRTLVQSPTFTVLTVLTLALAIGVNTAIFSMVNVLMFRPLPVRNTEGMAFIYSSNPEIGITDAYVSPADFLDFREQLTTFDEIAGVNRGRAMVMTGVDEPVRIVAFEATANTLDVWGAPPVLGRSFQAGEDRLGADRVVLLSHSFWERRFEADENVLGRTIKLDGFETTIIGVLDDDMEFGSLTFDVWTPLYLDRGTAPRDGHNIWLMGPLASGVTYEQAGQEIQAIAAGLIELYPETNAKWIYTIEDINGALANDQIWTIFQLLMLTVVFVMLIACSNIATMMLARASSRTKEIAVRAALGAGRARILSQLLTESIMLSLAAGALGLVAARACLAALVWMDGGNSGTNFFSLLAIDRNVLMFTGGVALLAPVLFGFMPALRASRTDLGETLKDNARGSSGGSGLRGRRVLVSTQVALALSLMVVAGLLIRAMIDQRLFDIGIETEGVLTMRIDLSDGKYPEEHQWLPFFDEVMANVEAIPGIGEVAWINARPLAENPAIENFLIDGEPVVDREDAPWAINWIAGPGSFDVLSLPVMSGRDFDRTDTAGSERVALVNQDVVERYFNGEDPLNRSLRMGFIDDAGPLMRIVGVVADVFTGDPDNPTIPAVYVPMSQNPRSGMGLIARPVGDPLAVVAAVREGVWAVDPDQPLGDIRTMSQIFDDNLATFDTIISIFIVFAVFALVMAATGIYGVMSFAVSQRTQEIGIRMALGAFGNDVVRMIGRQALLLVIIGVVIGGLGAVALSQVLAGAVPGLNAADPLALGGVALALTGAALLAIWIPARRAVRIDPVIALRQD